MEPVGAFLETGSPARKRIHRHRAVSVLLGAVAPFVSCSEADLNA
jgi:hypothetical protein